MDHHLVLPMAMHHFPTFRVTLLQCPNTITMLEPQQIQIHSDTRIAVPVCIVLTVSALVTTAGTANVFGIVQSPARALMLRHLSGIVMLLTSVQRLPRNPKQITKLHILTRMARTPMAMPLMRRRPMATPATAPMTQATHHIHCATNTNILPHMLRGTRTKCLRINTPLHHHPGMHIRARTPPLRNNPACSRAPCQFLRPVYPSVICFSTFLTKQPVVNYFSLTRLPIWPFVETLARNTIRLHVIIKNLCPIIGIDRVLASRTR